MLFLGYARNDTKTGHLGEALTGSNHNAIAYPYQPWMGKGQSLPRTRYGNGGRQSRANPS